MSQHVESPLTAFIRWEKYTPDREFLRQPIAETWKSWSYQQAGDEARRVASALRALNLPAGSSVAILSKNCAHWIMADLAIMMAGHVSVPIYPTLSAAAIQQILVHSEAKAIFLGKLDNYAEQRSALSDKLHRISFPLYGPGEGLRWEGLLETHERLAAEAGSDPDEVASIMYSSGTTGTPKGVMLTFRSFAYVGNQVKKWLRLDKPQRFFSYLPLSHIAERALMEMVALSSGSSISFSESIEKFPQNLQHEQPTIFGGVPRVFAKFQEGVLQKIPQKRLDKLLALPLVNIFVKQIITKKLGLSKASVVVCGAAPTPVALLEWFNALGIQIRETYGMTENTAYSHSNFRLIRNGTVGQPWPEVEVKIDEGGEILVRHPALMKGYFKDPQTTAAVITEEGFLRTGDQGQVDAQGYLTITGRLKDQFKTDKAKFIAPAPIELALLSNADIDQVCVVGKGLPQPIAIVSLTPSANGRTQTEVEQTLQTAVETLNKSLEQYERIMAAVIVTDRWTVENGLLTPSLKVKRREIETRYGRHFKDWLSQNKKIVWEKTAAVEPTAEEGQASRTNSEVRA